MAEDLEKKEEKAEVKTNGGKGFAIASMVLGIVSVVLFCLWYLAIPCAVLAIVFSVIAKKKAGKSGMTVAGLVLGIVSLGITAVMLILITVGLVASTSLLGSGILDDIEQRANYSRSYDYYNDYYDYYNYDGYDF